MKALILTWNGAGNQPPAVALAQALCERGWQVTFAGSVDQRPYFEQKSFAFEQLCENAAGASDPPLLSHVERSWVNPGHVAGVASLCARLRPDALVIDCLMFGAMAGAQRAGAPAFILAHSAPGALIPPGGALETAILPVLNALRSRLDLPQLEGLRAAWRPFSVLTGSLPEFDGTEPDPGEFYVGPLFDAEAVNWLAPWPSDDPHPLVLISFSTGRAWDQGSRIARTVSALAGSRFRALVTARERPRNVDQGEGLFLPFAPHRQVLRHASATVCHAGHGTLMASLAAGVPVVCLPNPGADQEALAARAVELGVGLSLEGETASPELIREAIEQVITNPSFAAAAAAVAVRIAACPGAPGAAERIAVSSSSASQGWGLQISFD